MKTTKRPPKVAKKPNRLVRFFIAIGVVTMTLVTTAFAATPAMAATTQATAVHAACQDITCLGGTISWDTVGTFAPGIKILFSLIFAAILIIGLVGLCLQLLQFAGHGVTGNVEGAKRKVGPMIICIIAICIALVGFGWLFDVINLIRPIFSGF